MKKRKICFVTGSRAEYGMQCFLMQRVKSDKRLKLEIIVTGTHLSKKFGYTYKEILKDKFTKNKKIKILSSSTKNRVAETTAIAIKKISSELRKIKPDILVIVGDRYEMFASAFAALINRIPIAHIHGGETTLGAFDESLRHSITKMSSWHFVSNRKYRKRVVQLGENPGNVFVSGGLGVDSIKKSNFLKKGELEKKLQFQFQKNNLLITYHPETLSENAGISGFKKLLKALSELKNTNFFFTLPNSDTGNEKITKMIYLFNKKNKKNSKIFRSLGRVDYLSILKNVDAVVGNSSSGLLEAPSLKTATINIGDRQMGRIKSQSVIDCNSKYSSIKKALKKIYTKNFKKKIQLCKNPYDFGDTSRNIFKILSKRKIPNNTKKAFFDLNF